MEVCVISSGSKGNCYLLNVNNKNILIDCGINYKELEKRLNKINKSAKSIDAVFITHEHTDHISGCKTLSNKINNIKFFFNKETYHNCKFTIPENQIEFFKNGIFHYNNIEINALSKNHDAANPVSFSFKFDNKKSSFITDIGSVCNNVINQIKNSNILIFEFNHDESMLFGGSYPEYLKQRIGSNKGHLSNIEAVNCLSQNIDINLKHLFLSHISSKNNNKNLAKLMIEKELKQKRKDIKDINILIAHEYENSEVVKV
ncbi:MBL fold metallo-hydrolase [Candidatus Woesearchaeota archaeon]|nr:MBL fold metallo-hydrolase [Candidatus Woesearchaeota archaeon]MBT4387386.1 MBL fold metallo-hydrolase [Candidatus Woesearchaeota archaeon]MBT4595524.1 MBL fold metallo-hydrolase [Candidatus Woesearchaeota archaeon]MBT5740993.1 MBL fold metallo-hydrolase [Candidatus Woesearchaeota archaeon]MBT6505418.1 MBL fold metallo-hydrolase [Candidatus Woesearchaeota archaeon]